MDSMNTLPKLLLVDDDRNIAQALALALRSDYAVTIAANGMQALLKADDDKFHAIILDLNLPDISGLVVCEQLRERGTNAPILVLSGENKTLSKIKLLDAGANDYLTKPFSLGELKARLRTLARIAPSETPSLPKQLDIGGLTLDRQAHTVTREGVLINLRRKEFALLECLMQHAGSVVNRRTLIRHAWQDQEDPWTNTIDVHIKYLRDKLDRPFDRALIKTVHGLGYRLVLELPLTTSKP
jgi:DNA-binding response OmpR family regulator